MNIKHNLIGKKDGKTVVTKLGLSYPDARELKASWEQLGCPLIMDEQRQLVKLDRIEMEAVEVLWSRGLETADMQRELNWSHDKVIVKENQAKPA